MQLFMPKGAVSRRKILTRLVREHNPGDVLTYEQLGEALEVGSKREIQSAVNGAKLTIEKETNHALIAVQNVGYRIILANEHLALALAHQKKSVRQVKRAKSKVDHVPLTDLSSDERAAVISASVAFAAQQRFLRTADARYARREELEEFMNESSRKSDRTDEELRLMKERIARLESGLGG